MNDFRNANGTYNGVKALAAWSGLSEAEVRWTAARIQELMKAGASAEQAKATVNEEAKSQPWLADQPGAGT
jgi:uncharacterized protein YoaH (UPF0181 family)